MRDTRTEQGRAPAPGQFAYADESFRESEAGGFYVLAAAVVESNPETARETMLDLRGTRSTAKLHWNEMDDKQKQHAVEIVAGLDGFHIVTVGAPVPRRRQERARAKCLIQLVRELHGFEVTTLHMESRTRELNQRDVASVIGARHGLPRGAQFWIEHTPGADEPLLWIADIVAGTVRAHQEGAVPYRQILDECLYETYLDTGC